VRGQIERLDFSELAVSWQQRALPGVPGHEPDPEQGAVGARQVSNAMNVIRALTPGAGSYVNEANYFEADWQQSFWGHIYARLREIKQRYDPPTSSAYTTVSAARPDVLELSAEAGAGNPNPVPSPWA